MSLYVVCTCQENACAHCLLKTCICCLWCLEKCLNYLNQVECEEDSSSCSSPADPPWLLPQNAYAATAINSTSFCTSARDAFVILVENALRVATINAVGDFVLFLGKVSCGRGLLLQSWEWYLCEQTSHSGLFLRRS